MLHACVWVWFFSYSVFLLKPESISLNTPVWGVTSVFGSLSLCWPGYTEHLFSLTRKTSCPFLVIQWKIHNAQLNSSVCKTTNYHLAFSWVHLFALFLARTQVESVEDRAAFQVNWKLSKFEPIRLRSSCSKCLTLMGEVSFNARKTCSDHFPSDSEHQCSFSVILFSAMNVFKDQIRPNK